MPWAQGVGRSNRPAPTKSCNWAGQHRWQEPGRNLAGLANSKPERFPCDSRQKHFGKVWPSKMAGSTNPK
jgi:hypothetical protein